MKFHFPEPITEGYTIYCKTACINCEKAKGFLTGENKKVKFIYCDLYLEDSFCRTEFLEFIKILCGYPNRTFPMILKTVSLSVVFGICIIRLMIILMMKNSNYF